jgi:hypothetical protein
MTVFYPEEIKKNIKLFSIIGIGLIIPNYYSNKKRYRNPHHSLPEHKGYSESTIGQGQNFDNPDTYSYVEQLSKTNSYLSNDFLRFPNDYIAFIILGGVIIPYLKYNMGGSYKVLFSISIIGAIIILSPDFVNRITTDGKLLWPNYGLLTIKD